MSDEELAERDEKLKLYGTQVRLDGSFEAWFRDIQNLRIDAMELSLVPKRKKDVKTKVL